MSFNPFDPFEIIIMLILPIYFGEFDLSLANLSFFLYARLLFLYLFFSFLKVSFTIIPNNWQIVRDRKILKTLIMWNNSKKASFLFANKHKDKAALFFLAPSLSEQSPVSASYLSFFASVNTFLIFFIPVLLLFSFFTIKIVSKSFINYKNIWYFFIPLLVISTIFFLFPRVMLLFTILASGFLLNLTYADFFSRWLASSLSANNLISFLETSGLLGFFFRLFSFVFITSSPYQFIMIALSSHLLSFFYVLLSRYFLFFSFVIVFPFPFPLYLWFLLFLCIFICLIALMVRLLINISLTVTTVSLNVNPVLLENFLLTLGDQPSDPAIKAGFRVSGWKALGFGIGICTLGLSCYIADSSAALADESAIAAERSAKAAERSADATEVTAGLRSKESYYKKWGDSPKN